VEAVFFFFEISLAPRARSSMIFWSLDKQKKRKKINYNAFMLLETHKNKKFIAPSTAKRFSFFLFIILSPSPFSTNDSISGLRARDSSLRGAVRQVRLVFPIFGGSGAELLVLPLFGKIRKSEILTNHGAIHGLRGERGEIFAADGGLSLARCGNRQPDGGKTAKMEVCVKQIKINVGVPTTRFGEKSKV